MAFLGTPPGRGAVAGGVGDTARGGGGAARVGERVRSGAGAGSYTNVGEGAACA